jgi:CYTH domain-containing protein
VDVFEGANTGLVVAEIELESESEEFSLPDWIGKEISADKRYYNAALTHAPYSTWTKK